jgi:hypothetical protein
MPTLRTAIVRYDHEPVTVVQGGKTLGMLIDEKLEQALREGQTLQEVGFQFDESEWNKMTMDFHNRGKKGGRV